ncbi:MAG: DUF4394 domain-containing protein [Chthoniobacteraceae bacterium]
MKTILLNSIVVTAILVLSTASSHAQTAYAIANNGNSLIKFDLATPGTTFLVGNFSGAATNLDGIDFRPADGQLYGYGVTGNALVTINLNTAATTAALSPSIPSTSDDLGIDFNPVADRLRLVNVNDQNLRINITGPTIADGSLAYIAGDANFGINPAINEAAYTNSDTNPVTGTSLFYIDYGRDILVSTLNPNAGSLQTVGPLGVDTTAFTGFDILSDGIGGNTAYALLTATSGIASLYTVNLVTGAASPVGVISQTAATRPYSLAIVQTAVPEPGTMLFGFSILGACLQRKRRK